MESGHAVVGVRVWIVVAVFRGFAGRETTELVFLDNQFLETPLAIGFFEKGLLHRPFCRKAVDDNGTGLADAVGAILGLQVLLGVPVAVKQDDGVGSGEVDTKAAGAGAEEEEAMVRLGVEGGDLGGAVFGFDGAVDAADGPVAEVLGPVF